MILKPRFGYKTIYFCNWNYNPNIYFTLAV